MRSIRKFWLLLAMLLLVASFTVSAAEVECDATYCFSAADFSEEEGLKGICITGLPDSSTGTVLPRGDQSKQRRMVSMMASCCSSVIL